MIEKSRHNLLESPDYAQQIVSTYDLLLNRNPVADEFYRHMENLAAGLSYDEFFHEVAATEEAAQRFLKNPNFKALINNLLKIDQRTATTSTEAHLSWKAQGRQLISRDPVSIMQIELTNDCPFRCVMCPRTGNMTRPIGMMSFDLFKKIIDELAVIHPDYNHTQPPIWLHHFGESLVHPEFGNFIRYAKSQNIPTAMSINPLMLTERIGEELLAAEPHALYLSLDGHDNESFERIRGIPNAYEKSRQRLLRFLARKIELGVKTHMTLSVIDFVLNGEKGAQQRMALEHFWKHTDGIDDFLWKPYGTFSGEFERLNELASPTTAQRLMRHYKDTFRVTCDFPWRRMVIAWSGDVVPCCHDYDVKMSLGNVQTESLAQIWNGEKMQALRNEFIRGNVSNPVCRDCEHRYKNNPREA
jgi:radical SAM protein with 4Fe4S-binding SPASM domain